MERLDFEVMGMLKKVCQETDLLASMAFLAWMHSLSWANETTIHAMANMRDKSTEIHKTMEELIELQEAL